MKAPAEVERLVRAARKGGTKDKDAADPYADLPGGEPAVKRESEELRRVLGTKVRIVPQGKRGRIEIDFTSVDELNRLITHLKG